MLQFLINLRIVRQLRIVSLQRYTERLKSFFVFFKKNILLARWHQKTKETSSPSQSQNEGPEGQESRQWWKATPTPHRARPGEISLNTMPPSSSPDHWVSHEEDGKQTWWVHLYSCRWQGQQAPEQTGCAKTPWHPCSQSQQPVQNGLWAGLCSAGSWFWWFGYCQQNWDHLNLVQMVNSKYNLIFTMKKKKQNKMFISLTQMENHMV